MKGFAINRAKVPWGYIIVGMISIATFWVLVARNDNPISLKGNTKVYLGLSVVEQDFSTILRAINGDSYNNNNSGKNDWLTSYLLQSPDPAALIYLDYIRFDKDVNLATSICFNTITLTKSGNVPVQFAPEVIPPGLAITSEQYEYVFPSERCMQQGEKYIMPHILLGVLPVNASANILKIVEIRGYRASDFFPIDKQTIKFDVSVKLDNNLIFSPSIEAVVAQKGWDGNFSLDENNIPVLRLKRSDFYSWALLPFFVIMAIAIPFLKNIVEDTSGFLQIAFGLLLGLWGTHEIFTPNYITTSIPIDVVTYILFILLIAEILFALAPEINKLFLRIRIEDRNSKDEKTVIEFRSFFPLNLLDAYLCDHQHQNKYPLPPVQFSFSSNPARKIIIWTRKPIESDPSSESQVTYIYLDRDTPLWADIHGAVHLNTSSDKILATYSY